MKPINPWPEPNLVYKKIEFPPALKQKCKAELKVLEHFPTAQCVMVPPDPCEYFIFDKKSKMVISNYCSSENEAWLSSAGSKHIPKPKFSYKVVQSSGIHLEPINRYEYSVIKMIEDGTNSYKRIIAIFSHPADAQAYCDSKMISIVNSEDTINKEVAMFEARDW